jgi:hypothetical protein
VVDIRFFFPYNVANEVAQDNLLFVMPPISRKKQISASFSEGISSHSQSQSAKYSCEHIPVQAWV